MGAAGCAARAPLSEVASIPELANVPFFPQTEFDCGPAALATILGAAGIEITPEALMPSVYTEGLEGSLQVELLAAARREGRLPIVISPSTETLFELVESGYPVLVLQNLRLPRAPLWHYAVVVGHDAEKSRVILRSGTERAKRQRARRFATSWSLAENWAFVVARPGTVPSAIDAESYMRALIESQRALDEGGLDLAYHAAWQRWPQEPLVLFLVASRAHERGDLEQAATLYRSVIDIDPAHVASRNNLANVLLQQGCYQEAMQEAERALALASADSPFRVSVLDTLEEIAAERESFETGLSVVGRCG